MSKGKDAGGEPAKSKGSTTKAAPGTGSQSKAAKGKAAQGKGAKGKGRAAAAGHSGPGLLDRLTGLVLVLFVLTLAAAHL